MEMPYTEVTSFNMLRDGHNAIADLDGDARPEVIVLSSSTSMTSPVMGTSMWIFEHDGRHKANFGLFENVFNVVSYEIGPPTVADFDGDGEPEIAIPGCKRHVDCGRTNPDDPCRYFLSLYRYRSSDNSLQLLWRKDLIGHLSVIGLAVTAFDFDADGAAEMVLQDSQKLYILNGRDGTSLFEMGVERTNEGAGAGTRYPTVAMWTMTAFLKSSCQLPPAIRRAAQRAAASWYWATRKGIGAMRVLCGTSGNIM